MRAQLDLRNNEKITHRLIQFPMDWRTRAIEKIIVSGMETTSRTRVLDVAPIRNILSGNELTRNNDLTSLLPWRAKNSASAWIRLPLAMLPKKPLLDITVTLNDQRVYRLPRPETVRIQVGYLVHLANEAGVSINARVRNYLRAMGEFDEGQWRLLTQKESKVHSRKEIKRVTDRNIRKFLNKGAYASTGLSNVDFKRYLSWRNRFRRFFDSLGSSPDFRLRELARVADDYSAAENPLLALPQLGMQYDISPANVKKSLKELYRFLKGLRRVASSANSKRANSARKCLQSYMDFGRRWMIIAECLVPLNEPFSVELSETRAISPQQTAIQKFLMFANFTLHAAFRDARYNQVNMQLADQNVEFRKAVQPRSEAGERLNRLPEELHNTKESFFVHSFNPKRNYRIGLQCRVKPSLTVYGLYFLVGMVVAATAGAIVHSFTAHRRMTTGQLSLLLAPATFAASLLLVRESSHLGATLTKRVRRVILCFVGSLWAVVVGLFIVDRLFTTEQPRGYQATERRDLVRFDLDDRSRNGITSVWVTWIIKNNSSEKSNYSWDWEVIDSSGKRVVNSTEFVVNVQPGQTKSGEIPTTLKASNVKLYVTDFDRSKAP